MKIFKLSFTLIAMLLTFIACNKENNEEVTSVPSIYVIYSANDGEGSSYRDLIVSGVETSCAANNVILYDFEPEDADNAEDAFVEWLVLGDANSLMILAANEFESLAVKYLSDDTYKDRKVLLFENDNQSTHAKTFKIGLYGASYLAGCVAKTIDNNPSAAVVCGSKADENVYNGAVGFINGFYGSDNSAIEDNVYYLADDATGYDMATEAKALCGELYGEKGYNFVYPIAGSSNQGIYEYINENSDKGYTAGIDDDESETSDQVVFSVLKHIDQVIISYISMYLAGEEFDQYQEFGIESGYVEVLLAPNYESEYKDALEANTDAAIAAEAAYNAN